jgi:hypothetical protein
MAPDLITITTHTRRDEAGRLVYLSIEGIPADWSDYTFKNEVFYDESTGGTLAPIAPQTPRMRLITRLDTASRQLHWLTKNRASVLHPPRITSSISREID